MRLTHYRLKSQEEQKLRLGEAKGEYLLVPPNELGSGIAGEPLRVKLSEVVRRMNDLFEGELTESDFLHFATYVGDKMAENPVLRQQAQTNSKEQFALGDFQDAMMRAVVETLDTHGSMAKQVLANDRTRKGLSAILLDLVWENLCDKPGEDQASTVPLPHVPSLPHDTPSARG